MGQRRPVTLVPALALLLAGLPLPPRRVAEAAPPSSGRVRFTDVAAAAGLTHFNATGDPDRKDYIFEVKGGGVAALDYDGDGWVDLAFSRGSSLERWRKGENPGPVLYRNRGDGTFEDVTGRPGWRAGAGAWA